MVPSAITAREFCWWVQLECAAGWSQNVLLLACQQHWRPEGGLLLQGSQLDLDLVSGGAQRLWLRNGAGRVHACVCHAG